MSSHLSDSVFYELFQPPIRKVYIETFIIYNKDDDEYLSNGIYLIKTEKYMSMWAFKKESLDLDEKDSKSSAQDTINIKKKLSIQYRFKCKPDLEEFKHLRVQLFKEKDLIKYFGSEGHAS